ncbi:MAG: hypothetical protein U5K79_21700 [Cyclobacteriaceae bacterium]|nr:hypothetical protein [Cyclobacteriaceae bacterium]
MDCSATPGLPNTLKGRMRPIRQKILIKSVFFSDKSLHKNEITELCKNIQQQTIEVKKKKTVSINFRVWNYIKVAAVLLPFVATSVLFLFYKQSPQPQIIAQNPVIQKSNPKGQKLTFFLSDGSKVKLNSESSISFLKRLIPLKE